ncbi:hypothetical protein [Streptomyces sp. NPDC046197]|uniref:hypothetical protein n=1 Tax=Streptomyces sp. NPDC046197 TaxID=3154337 RepID=UPI0033F8655E
MNPDKAPEDLAARIAAISITAPADHIDIDEAVRVGSKRRRRRWLAVAGVCACVVAVAGSVAVATQMRHDRSVTTAAPQVRGPALGAERLTGRWIAVQVDGRDVSSWRDVGGLPANIVIGADGSPDTWQVNRACGPLVGAGFTLHPDGSFAATLPPRRGQSCPMLTTPTPDLLGAVARTAYVVVDEPGGTSARTLRFLDSHRRLVALWREDTATRSPASVCEKGLGHGAAFAGTFTTVERVRDKRESATNQNPEEVLSGVPGGTVAIRCAVTEAGSTVRYAVTAGGQKVRLRPGT